MRAILIDPVKKTVTEVEYNGDFTQIYEYIHASCFTTAGNLVLEDQGSKDDMFVDDEGLFDPKFGYFVWKGYPTPLAGYGLLLGTSQDGEQAAALSTIEDLEIEFGQIGRIGSNVFWMNDAGYLTRIPE